MLSAPSTGMFLQMLNMRLALFNHALASPDPDGN